MSVSVSEKKREWEKKRIMSKGGLETQWMIRWSMVNWKSALSIYKGVLRCLKKREKKWAGEKEIEREKEWGMKKEKKGKHENKMYYLRSGKTIFFEALAAGVDLDFSIAMR